MSEYKSLLRTIFHGVFYYKLKIDYSKVTFEKNREELSYNFSDITSIQLSFLKQVNKPRSARPNEIKLRLFAKDYLLSKVPETETSTIVTTRGIPVSYPNASVFPVVLFFVKNKPAFFINFHNGPGKIKPIKELCKKIGIEKCAPKIKELISDHFQKIFTWYLICGIGMFFAILLFLYICQIAPDSLRHMITANPTAKGDASTFVWALNFIFSLIASFSVIALLWYSLKIILGKNDFQYLESNSDLIGMNLKIAKGFFKTGFILILPLSLTIAYSTTTYSEVNKSEIISYSLYDVLPALKCGVSL